MADFLELTGGLNLFVLVQAPGEETLCCGGLIAEACMRGRPPFVAILSDGGDAADALARQTRAAVAHLGVPADWLLLLGLRVAATGLLLDAAVRAVAMLTWRYDCNLIVAPADDPVAAGVVAATGIRRLGYGAGVPLCSPRGAARRAEALALHRPLPPREERYAWPTAQIANA